MTDSVFPTALDNLQPTSLRTTPSLASVLNAIEETIGITGAFHFGGVKSVVAGTNVTVDDTDPANPVVSASGGTLTEITSTDGSITITNPDGPVVNLAGTFPMIVGSGSPVANSTPGTIGQWYRDETNGPLYEYVETPICGFGGWMQVGGLGGQFDPGLGSQTSRIFLLSAAAAGAEVGLSDPTSMTAGVGDEGIWWDGTTHTATIRANDLAGEWVFDGADGHMSLPQLTSAPPYVKGGVYFDSTLNKLRIGGATAWETVTST